MNIRRPLLVVLALGAAASLSAFGGKGPRGHRPDGPPPRGCPRDTGHGVHGPPAPTPEQKTFLEAERLLRDSLHMAVRSYADTVSHGALARDLPIHRARITDFAHRLERLRAENLDVWLDVMALRPDHHARPGHRTCHKPGDSLASPDADVSDAPPPPHDAH